MTRRGNVVRRVGCALVAGLAALLAGCGGSPAGPASATGPTLRVSLEPGPGTVVGLVVQARDMLKGSGIHVRWVELHSGVAIRDALVGGSLDVANAADTVFLVTAARYPVEAIAVQSYGGERQKVMVAKNSAIRDLRGLVGHRVAVQKGSSAAYNFVLALQRAGIRPSSVPTVGMKVSDMAAALAAGSVDGFVAWDPYPVLAERAGTARELMNFASISSVSNLLMVTDAFAAKHRAELVRFLRVWVRAERFVNAHPRQTAAILQNVLDRGHLKLPGGVVREMVREVHYRPDFTPRIERDLGTLLQQLKASGKVHETPAIASIIDTSLLRQAEAGRKP